MSEEATSGTDGDVVMGDARYPSPDLIPAIQSIKRGPGRPRGSRNKKQRDDEGQLPQPAPKPRGGGPRQLARAQGIIEPDLPKRPVGRPPKHPPPPPVSVNFGNEVRADSSTIEDLPKFQHLETVFWQIETGPLEPIIYRRDHALRTRPPSISFYVACGPCLAIVRHSSAVTSNFFLPDNIDMKTGAASNSSLQDFDFVPSSQPFEDGEDDSCWLEHHTGTTEAPTPTEYLDFVPSSQPVEDGEMYQGLETPAKQINPGFCSDWEQISETCRRPRLIRRAPPVKQRPAGDSPANMPSPISVSNTRSAKLVRRVTIAPALERQRRRAREEASRIAKQIKSLTKTTTRLRCKHRELHQFITSTNVDKENIFKFCF
ncbi:hypothetical protein C8R45DRAFT_1173837 [Mycena sanguinolenta]|nr:hypothetical protein C8R45DRAFT_1173837 [Mycena sanguinolenta]